MRTKANGKSESKKVSRTTVINVIILIVFIAFLIALIKIQLVDKDLYSKSGNIVSSYNVVVDSARGEILDRNGNPIVTNRQSNSLVFNAAYFPKGKEQEKRNKIISGLIKLFEENGQAYIDTLPIVINANGEYAFADDKEEEIEWLKSSDMLDLNSYATADNCMKALVKRYNLESYSKEDARKIASVCVQMKKEYFSQSYPYTFAEDVPTELVAKIMENSDYYKGVEVNIEPYRIYTDGTLAPHIIGRIGSISSEKYAEKKKETESKVKKLTEKGASQSEIESLKRNSYKITDLYGEFGIENYAEDYLRGTRGVKTVSTDANGNVSEKYTVEPKQGDTVILTIDKNLQTVAQQALKNRVDTLSVQSRLPCAAAVVVMKVDTGEILACATYPSYDISTYQENYASLSSDPLSPLWNRALKSTYEPGSTFKPLVAMAALENGTINESFTFRCPGYYDFYKDMRPFECQGVHGSVNVVEAINKSCNTFFYETGRLLGISKMNEYGSMFGLGQATGVELPEAQGVLASKEYRESVGGKWYPGDTIQAAIGQSDNLFTPLQLANYVSTIANGGTRYVPHFIKSVKSYDYKTTVLEKEPEIAVETEVSPRTLSLVKEGMRRVGAEGGFCYRAFKDLPVQAAAKTGTSTVVKKINGENIKSNNGFLISFAPYENPEIAISVVVETADKGSLTAVVAADIYQYYFSNKGVDAAPLYNQLLS